MAVKTIYKTTVTSTGGRDGRAQSADGSLDVKLVKPKEMGGSGESGANPETLFGAGYSACFLGAMKAVSEKVGVKVPDDASVTAEIGFGPRDEGGYGITASLTAKLPGLSAEDGKKLMDAAHEVCPYSNATRGNIDVGLNLAK